MSYTIDKSWLNKFPKEYQQTIELAAIDILAIRDKFIVCGSTFEEANNTILRMWEYCLKGNK